MMWQVCSFRGGCCRVWEQAWCFGAMRDWSLLTLHGLVTSAATCHANAVSWQAECMAGCAHQPLSAGRFHVHVSQQQPHMEVCSECGQGGPGWLELYRVSHLWHSGRAAHSHCLNYLHVSSTVDRCRAAARASDQLVVHSTGIWLLLCSCTSCTSRELSILPLL